MADWRTIFDGLENDAAVVVDVLGDAGIEASTSVYRPDRSWGWAEPPHVVVSVRRLDEGRAANLVRSLPELDLASRETGLRRRQGFRAVAEFDRADQADKALAALRTAGIGTAVVTEPLEGESHAVGHVISVGQRDLPVLQRRSDA